MFRPVLLRGFWFIKAEKMSASGKRNSLSSIFEDELDYERSGYQAPPSIDVVVNYFFSNSFNNCSEYKVYSGFENWRLEFHQH